MAAELAGIHRLKSYKTRKIDVQRIRSKKEEEGIQLRKERRYEQFHKRRNIGKEDERSVKEKDPDSKDNNEQEDAGENVNEKNKKAEDKVELNEDTPLDKVANLIMEAEGDKRLEAVRVIRRHLSKANPPIEEVISTGVVPYLVDCVNPEEPEALQMEAAWALTNIASGSSEQTRTVVQAGGVPRLIQLLEAPNSSVREQVVWALGNITGDSAEYRDLVVDYGIIPSLANMLGDGNETIPVKRQAAWLVSNVCRHKHSPLDHETIELILPVFVNGFEYQDDSLIMKDLCWGVSYLTEDGDVERVQMVLDSGVLDRVIELLDHEEREVIQSAIRFVGNITTGSDLQTQQIIDCGGLPKLRKLMKHNVQAIQREACWAMSNITAGTTDQKQAVINNEVVPVLMDILSSNDNFRVTKEAIWALSNITENATEDQISYLVGLGTLQTLIDTLKLPQNEIKSVSLDGILGILEAGDSQKENGINPFAMMIIESDIVSVLTELQVHENEVVYEKCARILDQYIDPASEVEDKDGSGFNRNTVLK